MIARIALFAAQLAVLAAGAAGAVLGPGWHGPAIPPGTSSQDAGRLVLDRKGLHLANAWQAIARASDPRGAGGPAPAKLALLHARAALGQAPASGYAWLALAWAERLAGDDGAARTALERSWQVAPQSRTLALPRLVLASAFWADLTAAGRTRLIAGMRFAQQADPARFRRLVLEDIRIAALWRLARARGLDRGPRPAGSGLPAG